MASVAIVLGSVRPGRAGEQVVRWIEEQARQLDGVSTVFFDLRDYQLPLFAEEMPPSMQAPELPEAVRPLKWYASWVQNVVRQFGPYPLCAQET